MSLDRQTADKILFVKQMTENSDALIFEIKGLREQ